MKSEKTMKPASAVKSADVIKPTDILAFMNEQYALFGLFFAFTNRLQAVGDTFYEDVTCKQFFLMACLHLFPEQPPTAQELAQVMGSSHQNIKQILNKLEKKGYVKILPDSQDKRKLRITVTEQAKEKSALYQEKETIFMERLFDGINSEQVRQTFNVLAHMEENLRIISDQCEQSIE